MIRLSFFNKFPRLWMAAVFLWMLVIFILSTSFFSSEQTDKIDAPFNIRFLAHIVVYCILGFLASGAVELHSSWKHKFLITLTFCVIYALTDELHQYFEPNRAARLQDVIKDGVGAFLGILIHRRFYLGWIVKKGI